MNPLIKEQLSKLNIPTAAIDGKTVKTADIPDNATVIQFNSSAPIENQLSKTKLYHFVFEKYIVKPPMGFDLHNKWNQGKVTPLTYMYGKVADELGKMYYLKCYGSEIKSSYCHHCLRYLGKDDILCTSCKQSYGIINEDEDIHNVVWEGWVPKKSIVFAEEIE